MPARPRYRRLLLWLLGSLMALGLVVASHRPTSELPPDQGLAMGVAGGRVLPRPAGLQVPHALAVVLQIEDLRALELSRKTFRVEGRLHLQWDGALDRRLRQEGIAPERMVRFVNQVEDWNSVFEATGPAQPSANGAAFTQSFRFEGQFYVDAIDLRSAPFLRLLLPLILEVADDRLAIEREGVVLEPLRESRWLTGQGIGMAGFRYRGAAVTSALHRLDDPFASNRPQTLSRVLLRLDYRTDDLAAFLRWILPLLLVMAVVLLAPSLDSVRDELSFGLPSAGLLTLVVLQEGYRAQVPPTPYLTVIDQLYAYSYAVAVAVFLLFLWGGNLRAHAGSVEADRVLARINRVGSIAQISALLGYALIVVANLRL